MKPGHVFTIEPMINAGSWHDQLWPDDWTDVTQVWLKYSHALVSSLYTLEYLHVLTITALARGTSNLFTRMHTYACIYPANSLLTILACVFFCCFN